jgi:hypothetical protein
VEASKGSDTCCNQELVCSITENRATVNIYRDADKSLTQPGRKQAVLVKNVTGREKE